MTDLDWGRAMLPKVSRTFALAIGALDDPWDRWVTSSYLVCRVADTVEDAPDLPWHERRALFDAFDRALRTGDAAPFVDRAAVLPVDDEGELARGLPRVLAPIASYPEEVRGEIVRWVLEMTAGMASYAARREAAGTAPVVLEDEDDLLRYCHFVAGTVGGLLTELFVHGSDRVRERARILREHAEGFGLLLQLTNIAKDVREDLAEGRCFVPRSFCEAHHLEAADLFAPGRDADTAGVIRTVVDLARRYVPDAERYIRALPPKEVGIRNFCTLPALLATSTLDLLAEDPTGSVRKVDRTTVASILARMERPSALEWR